MLAGQRWLALLPAGSQAVLGSKKCLQSWAVGTTGGPGLLSLAGSLRARHAVCRFPVDYISFANAGLKELIFAMLDLKKKYPCITAADIMALAGAVAIEAAGGECQDGLRPTASPMLHKCMLLHASAWFAWF
jgi:hypothetical protein